MVHDAAGDGVTELLVGGVFIASLECDLAFTITNKAHGEVAEAANGAALSDLPDLSISAGAWGPGDGSAVSGQAVQGRGVEDLTRGRDGLTAGDTEGGGAVGGDAGCDLLGGRGGLAGPQVLNGEVSSGNRGVSDSLDWDGDVCCGVAAVENSQQSVAVGESLGEDIPGTVLADQSGLQAKSILVNSK